MREALEHKIVSSKFTISRMISFFLFLILSVCMMSSVGQGTKVVGSSMENTFMEGDSLFIDKLSYHFTNPKRFDIVVFPFQEGEESVFYIKRVIGMPGETIQIAGDHIYINGEILLEEFGKEAMEEGSEGIALYPYTLGEDEYFVLGDNRNFSIDSRQPQVGAIKKEMIIGKYAFRLWPF